MSRRILNAIAIAIVWTTVFIFPDLQQMSIGAIVGTYSAWAIYGMLVVLIIKVSTFIENQYIARFCRMLVAALLFMAVYKITTGQVIDVELVIIYVIAAYLTHLIQSKREVREITEINNHLKRRNND